jgi:hypothetical protein
MNFGLRCGSFLVDHVLFSQVLIVRKTATGAKRPFGLTGLSKFSRKLRGSSLASQRQFADVDHARRCQDRNFEMICLYNICDVARPIRNDVAAGPAPQTVVE